jgi:hypothetical protein
MKRLIVMLAAAAGVLAVEGRSAAQGFAAGFNPWTGRQWAAGQQVNPFTGGFRNDALVRNPWTGAAAGQTTGFNPFTGRMYQQQSFVNPWTGVRGQATQVYNPWTNQYRYRWDVRR